MEQLYKNPIKPAARTKSNIIKPLPHAFKTIKANFHSLIKPETPNQPLITKSLHRQQKGSLQSNVFILDKNSLSTLKRMVRSPNFSCYIRIIRLTIFKVFSIVL